ncbi:hypothetical protein QIS99_12635 [Streptomyces sp. B-S-A8]|uniref:Uncharacterized protein n=1 Tax=Streptomyces solicavernae TaxID=3043614 RepID=A0ABT6RTD0_9ACTN|nr:hypothetical protein [Streptomyces sp. B-S-A8]MDI3387038.1 hypothetical protein [Streptomyces sp. B-S-A8]
MPASQCSPPPSETSRAAGLPTASCVTVIRWVPPLANCGARRRRRTGVPGRWA